VFPGPEIMKFILFMFVNSIDIVLFRGTQLPKLSFSFYVLFYYLVRSKSTLSIMWRGNYQQFYRMVLRPMKIYEDTNMSLE
jgi:hypothetical protein